MGESITTDIILALIGKENASIRDMVMYITKTKKLSTEALKPRIRYNIEELMLEGIVTSTRKNRYIFYTLSKNVEILHGKMVSCENGSEKHSDDVGRILRMQKEDGEILILMLDK